MNLEMDLISYSNIEICKIICYGKQHQLPRPVIPLEIKLSENRTRYVLPGVLMPAMLNVLGKIKCFKGEMIWVEDSLSSHLAYAKL